MPPESAKPPIRPSALDEKRSPGAGSRTRDTRDVRNRSRFARALWGALACIGLAAVVYVLGVVSLLPGECEFRATDKEGSSSSSEMSFWPPETSCRVRSPDGKPVRVVTEERSWVVPSVLGLLGIALVLVVAGLVRGGLDRRNSPS